MSDFRLIIDFFFFVCIVLCLQSNRCWTIELQPIRVPSLVTEGSSVYLHCPFQLDGFLLEAVNWRKNDRLFFSFLPAQQPQKQAFPLSGVHIDLDRSNASHVFLRHLSHDSQGQYSCELRSNQPFHKQVSSSDQLTVVHSDYLLTPFLNTGPRTNITFKSTSAILPASRLPSLNVPFKPILHSNQSQTFTSVQRSSSYKFDSKQLAKELENLRWPQSSSSFSSSTTAVPNSIKSNRNSGTESTTTLASIVITNALIKQSHVKSIENRKLNPDRSARLEVEEDDDERPAHARPAIASPMRPNWIRPIVSAQVLPLRSQQFHDIRFLLRNDVLLFQPFSTDSHSTPPTSAVYHTLYLSLHELVGGCLLFSFAFRSFVHM